MAKRQTVSCSLSWPPSPAVRGWRGGGPPGERGQGSAPRLHWARPGPARCPSRCAGDGRVEGQVGSGCVRWGRAVGGGRSALPGKPTLPALSGGEPRRLGRPSGSGTVSLGCPGRLEDGVTALRWPHTTGRMREGPGLEGPAQGSRSSTQPLAGGDSLTTTLPPSGAQ